MQHRPAPPNQLRLQKRSVPTPRRSSVRQGQPVKPHRNIPLRITDPMALPVDSAQPNQSVKSQRNVTARAAKSVRTPAASAVSARPSNRQSVAPQAGKHIKTTAATSSTRPNPSVKSKATTATSSVRPNPSAKSKATTTTSSVRPNQAVKSKTTITTSSAHPNPSAKSKATTTTSSAHPNPSAKSKTTTATSSVRLNQTVKSQRDGTARAAKFTPKSTSSSRSTRSGQSVKSQRNRTVRSRAIASKPKTSTRSTRPSQAVSSQRTIPLRAGAIAGATVTLAAAAGGFHIVSSTPSYEGSIELVGLLPSSAIATPAADASSTAATPAIEMAQANVAPPSMIDAVQTTIIDHADMVADVTTQLQQQGIEISERALSRQLQAQTTEQGRLEVHYRDTDPERVQQVLAQVADWYVSQQLDCDIQACRDVTYIESQIPILEQQQQDLETMLTSFNRTIDQKIGTTNIEAKLRHLSFQQNEQARRLTTSTQNVAQARTHLQTLHGRMYMKDATIESSIKFLHHVVPSYGMWLTDWKRGDRQLIDASLSFDSAQRAQSESIARRQNQLLSQMSNALVRLSEASLMEMPLAVRELVLGDLVRFDYLLDWLNAIHRLQILEGRHDNLVQSQEQVTLQAQELKHQIQVQAQLNKELAVTTETLDAYQERYAVLRDQATPYSIAWEVVEPPKVVRRPPTASWLMSRNFDDDAEVVVTTHHDTEHPNSAEVVVTANH